ncbi:MAG: hypothetical protein LUI02_03215 [Clostridiales bacterium]|nr:hypothetical protein [Clostridiales bacterium]
MTKMKAYAGRASSGSKYHPEGKDGPVGYDALGLAVILRAVEDYKIASKKLAKGKMPGGRLDIAKWTVEECARFFKSGWMLTLLESADLGGIDIQAELDQQIRWELERGSRRATR